MIKFTQHSSAYPFYLSGINIPAVEKMVEFVEIKKVGVIGCGQMGAGITQVSAQSGYPVIVSEINDELLKRGLSSIESTLDRGVKRGKFSPEDKDAAISRIKGTTDMRDFQDCDIVIEAAVEDIDVKREIFGQIDSTCPEHTILATNTSCLSVTELAAATNRPDRFLGLHFFNPVPSMKLLEIIKTNTTSKVTLETGKRFGTSLGKTFVIVDDSPGFIVNRLMTPQILNAIRMVESGIATREDIDTGMTLGLNYPMGPLVLADLIGLDTLLYIASTIHNALKDAQYAVPKLLNDMVDAGNLGRKSGKGFYEY